MHITLTPGRILAAAIVVLSAWIVHGFVLGCVVLLCGDKLVRPMVARGGKSLPCVWLLMGCVGGFGVLGLAGLVIGPVVPSLASELWEQRVRELAGRSTPS